MPLPVCVHLHVTQAPLPARKGGRNLPTRTVQAGELALDPLMQMLRGRRGRYRLRPKESALLAIFTRNPGRELRQRESIRSVWDTDDVGDICTLYVQSGWLPVKNEEDPGKPRLLPTVRGMGYRFEFVEPAPQATGGSPV